MAYGEAGIGRLPDPSALMTQNVRLSPDFGGHDELVVVRPPRGGVDIQVGRDGRSRAIGEVDEHDRPLPVDGRGDEHAVAGRRPLEPADVGAGREQLMGVRAVGIGDPQGGRRVGRGRAAVEDEPLSVAGVERAHRRTSGR